MKNFFEWFEQTQTRETPWLILGKGPSFEQLRMADVSGYRLMSLNHAVRERPVVAAHIIDIDVVSHCAEALRSHAGVLVMPWYPHVGNHVGEKTLEQWCAEIPTLASLDAEGRLLWYDLSTSPLRQGTAAMVRATYFSAEAALDLLAQAGVRQVRSLGVDGGNAYGGSFEDLKDVTRLNNGHATYDLQFQGFATTIFSTGVDYAPLTQQSPIKVYVGSQEEQMLAVRVLEYSIRRHASMSVQVMPLHRGNITFRTPLDPANHPRTPFSFQRFTIPQLADYKGRAIYLDSDMLVFQDIRKLWSMPFDGADLLAAREADASSRRPQFSVMLLDCEQLHWTPNQVIDALDSGQLDYGRLMYEMALAREVRAAIPPEWNSLEHYEEGRTALLHYTDMDRQPWLSRSNPWAHLWIKALSDAIAEGFITADEVREHVQQGWVRPSLLSDLRLPGALPHWIPKGAVWQDRKFVPPHLRAIAAA